MAEIVNRHSCEPPSVLAPISSFDGSQIRVHDELSSRLQYTARVTRYSELHGSCNLLHSSLHKCRYMAQKALVTKNGLVRPLVATSSNGPVRQDSSLQDLFRSLIKHQWETNCKLRLARFRACACVIARAAVDIVCTFPCKSQAAGARSLPGY